MNEIINYLRNMIPYMVMIQGLVGAFCVRVPVVILMSSLPDATLFQIGLATPMSSVCQIIICVLFMLYSNRKEKRTV